MVHGRMFDERSATRKVSRAKLTEMVRLLGVMHMSVKGLRGRKRAPIASLANDRHLDATRVVHLVEC